MRRAGKFNRGRSAPDHPGSTDSRNNTVCPRQDTAFYDRADGNPRYDTGSDYPRPWFRQAHKPPALWNGVFHTDETGPLPQTDKKPRAKARRCFAHTFLPWRYMARRRSM